MTTAQPDISEYITASNWKEPSLTGGGNAKALIFIWALSLSFSLILVLSYGNIFAAIGFLVAVLVVTLTIFRVQWGFFLFIGLVLSLDQFGIPQFEPLTLKASYFRNIKEIPFLPFIDAAVMNPLELHFLLILAVWFAVISFRKDYQVRSIPVWVAALLFFLAVAGSLIYGIHRGGDFLVALWEVRALFYCAAMFFLVPQLIQTKRDLRGLMWVFILAVSFKAFQGIERFIRLGFSFKGIATLTNHEDPLFMATLIFLLLALVLFNAKDNQRFALIMLLFPLLMGIFVAQRRAAYAALATSFIAFTVILGKRERWMLAKVMLPALIFITVYSAVLWESESKFASPVRLIKSSLSNDKETAGERYYSNLYREFEKYDLAFTVKFSPVEGTGFGKKYFQPIQLANIPFPLRDYIPHNEILWLVVKMGAVGFFFFWFFLNSFGCYGAHVYSKLTDPYLKSVCCVALVAVVGQITVSYYDLQLTYYRNMVHLGTLMGVVASLESLQASLPEGENGEQLGEKGVNGNRGE